MTKDSPRILLVEDNPGDARLVQEMVRSIEPFDRRIDRRVGGITDPGDLQLEPHDDDPQTPNVTHVDRLSAGLDELDGGEIDIVLLDLNLPDSRGIDTLDALTEAAPTVPVVVLTGVQDREMGLEAFHHGAQEYLVKDEINSDLLVRTIFHAIQRERYERELEHQHERISVLYEISTAVQDIGGSLIDYSTPLEIKSAVCNRLARSDAYRFAWIGGIDREEGAVAPVTEATPDGFFDGLTFSIDHEDSSEPVTTAVFSKEVTVVRDIEVDPEYEGLREHARAFGYRSVAAIPISYEDTLYGVLVVYSARSEAFEDEELGTMKQLGNVVGHAINAVERRAALMNDETIELELLLADFVDGLSDESQRSDNRIEFISTIPAGGGSYLQYAVVHGLSEESLQEVLGRLSGVDAVKEIDDASDRRLVEIRYSDSPIVSTLATHGAKIRHSAIVRSDYHVTVDLPTDADIRAFVESIREAYPGVNLVAQRLLESERSSSQPGLSSREASLTERQRAAVESAYFSGYFDRPRTTTGEEVAESLNISASTFHQHLQAGLRKLLAAEFEEPSVTRR